MEGRVGGGIVECGGIVEDGGEGLWKVEGRDCGR